MTIHCRIIKVNLEKFSVDLTCRSSDLADQGGKFRYAVVSIGAIVQLQCVVVLLIQPVQGHVL